MARTVSLESKVFASAGIKVNPDNDTSAGADLLTITGGHVDAQGPYSSHVNFIENRQDALLNLIEKHGILPWSDLTAYEPGALCKVDRTFYQLVEGGDGTQDPSTDDGANWEEFTSGGGGSSFVDVQTEEITLALDQTEVTLSNASTSNMELYIEGAREFDFTVTGQKTFELPESFPDGTRIWVVSAEQFVDADSALVTAAGSTTARSFGARFSEVINVKDFGAVGSGEVDDSPAVSAAFDELFLRERAALYFPPGRYRLDSAVEKSVPDKMDYEIYGDGPASIVEGNNTTGAIILTASSRKTCIYLHDMNFSPLLDGSGTGFGYSAPSGGVNGKRVFHGQNVTFSPWFWGNDGIDTQWWTAPLAVTGVNRPLFENIVMFQGSQSDISTEEQPYALLNIDGCYKPHITKCYINGQADRGISCFRDGFAEGFYLVETTVNGADVGVWIDQDDRHPEVWIVNSHVNSKVKSAYINGCKYVWILNNLMYCQPGSADDFIDFDLVGCDHVVVENNTYRQNHATLRRHVKVADCLDVKIDDGKGLAATTTVPPYYITGSSEDIDVVTPAHLDFYDFISYPDRLVEVDSTGSYITQTSARSVIPFDDSSGAGEETMLYVGKDMQRAPSNDRIGGVVLRSNDASGEYVNDYVMFRGTAVSEDDGYLDVLIRQGGSLARTLRLSENGAVGAGPSTPMPAAAGAIAASSSGGFYVGASEGVSGSFTSSDGKTITVQGGIITGIV